MVKCEECDTQLIEAKDLAFLSDISKGGLTIPSREFSDFVSKVYAFLDFFINIWVFPCVIQRETENSSSKLSPTHSSIISRTKLQTMYEKMA